MRPQSAKSKGRRLQQWIVDQILQLFPDLTKRDVQSTSMGASGDDVKLSEAAVKKFPWSIESKNTERLQIWQALEQADGNNRELPPLLVFKRNRSDVYVALKWDDFIQFYKD